MLSVTAYGRRYAGVLQQQQRIRWQPTSTRQEPILTCSEDTLVLLSTNTCSPTSVGMYAALHEEDASVAPSCHGRFNVQV